MRASVAVRPGERLDRVRWMTAGILIVEDDRNIGNLVQTYLERDGYRVTWVRSRRGRAHGARAAASRPRGPGRGACPASTGSRSAGASGRSARRR